MRSPFYTGGHSFQMDPFHLTQERDLKELPSTLPRRQTVSRTSEGPRP